MFYFSLPWTLLQYITSMVVFKIEPETGIWVHVVFGDLPLGERECGKCERGEEVLSQDVVSAGIWPQPGPTESSGVWAVAEALPPKAKLSELCYPHVHYWPWVTPLWGGSDGKESTGSAGDQVRLLGREDPLEKGLSAHSILHSLAWRTPWTEENGGLQSMGSQRLHKHSLFHTHIGVRLELGNFPVRRLLICVRLLSRKGGCELFIFNIQSIWWWGHWPSDNNTVH